MELQLNKVRFQHEVYPESAAEASRQILLVSEIEVRDRLASSHINKFLYQYSSEAQPRQSHANMFAAKAVHLRPDPRLATQECCLKLSLLPLRLNIDQDSLLFLVTFFTELSGAAKHGQEGAAKAANPESAPGSKQGTPTHHPPVMSVNEASDRSNANDPASLAQSLAIDRNLMILLEDELTIKESKSSAKVACEIQENSQPVYFRSVYSPLSLSLSLSSSSTAPYVPPPPLPSLIEGFHLQ
jgi:autophagy-related protein 2